MGKVKQIAIHNTVYTLEGDKTSIIANHAIPNTWHTSGTMVQLISDINNDETATEGKSYTGTVSLSDLPASMIQAEMKIEITKGSTSGNKIILFTIASENTVPYHWERVSAYGRSGNWRSFLPDKNIDSTATNNSSNLITSGAVYNAVANKADGSSLGYPIFDENTNYAANDTVFYNGKLYFFNQAHNAGAWDLSEVSPSSIKASLNALTTGKVDRVQNATNGNIAVLNSSGNIVDAGLAMMKMTKAEYDALVTKDSSTVYLVDCSPASFNGLEICPAPLYYGANGFEIKDSDWKHPATEPTIYGKQDGSYHFNFTELGSFFDSRGSSFDDNSGSIDNANTLDGWRLPTQSEMYSIANYDNSFNRSGSTVNGVEHCHYALIKGSASSFCINSYFYGLLVFPDGATITGPSVVTDSSAATDWYGGLESNVNTYLSYGCAFIPQNLYKPFNSSGWNSNGMLLGKATEVTGDTSMFYGLRIFNTGPRLVDEYLLLKTDSLPIRLVREVPQVQKLYLGNILIADSSLSSEIESLLSTI